jgi:hypothetical protein
MDANTEAEKFTLLGAVTQKRLVTMNWEDIVCVVVRSRVGELLRALQLLAVMIYNFSISNYQSKPRV